VAFPDSSGQVLKQGVPSGINSVEVIVYRSGNRVGSAQLMPAKPSATLSLKPGFTYRFTSSTKNNGTEVAWGDISQDVGSNTKITLPLRTIGVSAGFGATTYNSATNTLNVPLVLTAPDGSPVPLADYGDPVYTVKGGKLVLDFGVPVSTKLGAVINPDSPSGSVEVSVNVKALGADHKEKNLLFTGIVIPAQSGSLALTINAPIVNWPKSAGYTGVKLQAFAVGSKSLTAASSPPARGVAPIHPQKHCAPCGEDQAPNPPDHGYAKGL